MFWSALFRVWCCTEDGSLSRSKIWDQHREISFSSETDPSRDGSLAGRPLRLRLVLTLGIELYCGAYEGFQGGLIDLISFTDVDSAPDIALEAGVEQTGGDLQRSSFGKGHLDDAFVRFPRADDATVREDGS